MSVTFEDVFRIMLSNMDEIQADGTVSGDTRNEYEAKSFEIGTQAQRELMKDGDLYETFEIAKTRIDPLRSSVQVDEHNFDDETFETAEVTRAYYFEVNGPATVFIEDFTGTWNIIDTIIVPSTVTTYTAFKAIVTPTVGASKSRIRFSGPTYYNFTNWALWEENFADLDRVPDFRPWVKFEMPDDFKSVDRIIDEFFPSQYIRNADYKWEAKKDLYLSYNFTGNVRIIYKPIPLQLTTSTDVIQLDDITATTVLPDMMTARILATENPDLANLYLDLAAEGKAELKNKPAQAENKIVDAYGSSSNFRNNGSWNNGSCEGGFYG